MDPKSLYLSLLLEIIGIAFFINMSSFYHMLIFLLLHSVALYIVVNFLTFLIYKRFKNRKSIILSLFVIVFPTLYFGYFFALAAVFYLLRKQKIDAYRPPDIPSLEEVITEELDFSGRKIGEAAFAVVKNQTQRLSPSRLELMISYLSSLDSSHTMLLLRDLLSSSDDIIRLYAFGSLYKKEKKISEFLHTLKEKLKKDLPQRERASIHYDIASMYYTLIHYHLVDPELKDYTFKEAIDNIQKSIQTQPTSEAKLLLAKIYIEAGDFENALSLLQEVASEGKLDPVKYIIQLAQVYYEMGNYKEVKRLFDEHPEVNLLIDVDINFVVRFWRGSNGQIG